MTRSFWWVTPSAPCWRSPRLPPGPAFRCGRLGLPAFRSSGEALDHLQHLGATHTWGAYEASFRSLVEDADVRNWIGASAVPPIVLQGTSDRVCPPKVLQEVLVGLAVDLRITDGDHHLPLRRRERCLEVVDEALGEAAS